MSISVDLTLINSEMQQIRSWKDVNPFAGSVVAYKTNSFYLGAFKGYALEDESIKFGYINEHIREWDGGEKGYVMARLLKREEVSRICILVDSQLNSPISMRLASSDEINLIGKAILADQAKFENILDTEYPTIRGRHLSKL